MRNRLVKSIVVAAVSAALVLFVASGLFAGGTKEASKKKGYVIGLSMHFMRDDYSINVVNSVKAVVAEHPGSTMIATDANTNGQKQLTDMETLIARGVNALIVCPWDEKAILPAIKEANQKNIPVIAITYIPNAKVLTTVASTGDYANGKASGELLVKKLNGHGKIAAVLFPFSLWRIDQRVKGFEDALKGTDVKIVARVRGADQADIENKVAGILAAHPDLNGIWCTFSNQVVAAGDAVKAANRKGVVVTGIDADKSIIELIKEGWVTGTAAQFPKIHGRLAAEAAFNYLEGKPVKKTYEVPVGLVTPANADAMCVKVWGSCK